MVFRINDSGLAVGATGTCAGFTFSYLYALHATLWQNGSVIDLGNLGGTGSQPPLGFGNFGYYSNNSGQVVGTCDTSSGYQHAFFWSPETLTQDVGTIPGDVASVGLSISDLGVVGGVSFPSGWLQAVPTASPRAFIQRDHAKAVLGNKTCCVCTVNSGKVRCAMQSLLLPTMILATAVTAVAQSDAKVASGLKEALSMGASKAVQLTGVRDGFYANPAIKILMPEKLRTLEKGLRMMGQGKQVDEFELSMNRAAESAAPAAEPIFKRAITNMSFSDARGILMGGNTAATDYFKRTTSEELTTAFRPVVEQAMEKTGVTQRYGELTKQMQNVPFGGRAPNFDINSYVVAKTLDGLFLMLGREEERVRTNPTAQVTPLLKQVFGRF